MINFLIQVPAIVWLVISSIFFAIGEFFAKKWGMQPGIALMIKVLILYALSSMFWLPALLHKNQLLIMGTAWLILALVVTVLLGFFVFHEKLNTLQWLGIILALAALILLNQGE